MVARFGSGPQKETDIEFIELMVIIVAVSIIMMLIGIPIAYVLGCVTVFGILLSVGGKTLIQMGLVPYTAFHSLNFTPLPLFVFMAYIISETKIGADIFDTANGLLSGVPGGLVVGSIWGEAAMAATMGMSGTTIIAVGKVALPEMERLGYNKRLSIGALLCGGVLGPLIPPSIGAIIYGILSRQSIGELFIAGVVPGLVLAIMLSGWTIITCLRHPEYAPRVSGVTLKNKLYSLRKVWPVIVIIIGILGGIYLGIVTATEAGAVGVLLTLLIAVVAYKFRMPHLRRSVSEAATVTAMIGLMVVAAMLFSYLVAQSGMIQAISRFIMASGLPPLLIIIGINIIILILGCFMDGLSIMLVSMPFFIPLVHSLDYNLIWFGILVIVNIEIGLITPPVGINLFLTSGTFRIPVAEVIRGALPYIFVLIAFLAVLIAFPQLALWLPSMMRA